MRRRGVMQGLYSLVGLVGTPLIRYWLTKRARNGKEDPARMQERFGHATHPRPAGRLVWLHAASVGEVQSMLALANALLTHQPGIHLLVTTGTVTSAALLARQPLARTIHQYVPVDTYPAVRRFLNHWRPDLALWVESEFWPQLLRQTKKRRIPMLLLNARLSARSAANWKRWPRTIRSLLDGFDTIFAGAPDDAQRLQNLGATRVVTAGNLKYDAAPLPADAAEVAALRERMGTRPVWVAASTHAGEEIMVAQAHRALCATNPDALCILVPRHATRGDSIREALQPFNISIAQRSRHEPLLPTTGIYLADTMGELGLWYRVADIVFLGGSLVAHGGHNPLEPARQHCAILSGPHTHNFDSMVQQFGAADAMLTVSDATALAQQIAALWQHPDRCRALAQRAYALTQQPTGAMQVILPRIEALLA